MSNCSGASSMSLVGLESKHFPTFRPDLDWEIATNNPLLITRPQPATTTAPPPPPPLSFPFLHPGSAHASFTTSTSPSCYLRQLPPPLHFPIDCTTFPRHETEMPAEFCHLVKPEAGIADCAFAGVGFPSMNFPRRIGLELNLGHRSYFSSQENAMVSRLCKWGRGSGFLHGLSQQAPRCQAEGCKVDLSHAKHYHRRHKVCELHSKAAKVVMGGIEQRFCQQCSRFHVLAEFDEVKRSCRKRLADHNRRRRKPQPGACGTNADNATGKAEHNGKNTSSLNDSPFSEATRKDERAAAASQVDSAQSSEAHALLKATSPSPPPSPLMMMINTNPTNPKPFHQRKVSDLQLLQKGPSLSLGGLDQSMAAEVSSSPSIQNLSPPSLFFPWSVPNHCRVSVSHQHRSPWCSPSPNNGSEASSRGSGSYQSQNQTDHELQDSIFEVELL